jgi:hypothetical protein
VSLQSRARDGTEWAGTRGGVQTDFGYAVQEARCLLCPGEPMWLKR